MTKTKRISGIIALTVFIGAFIYVLYAGYQLRHNFKFTEGTITEITPPGWKHSGDYSIVFEYQVQGKVYSGNNNYDYCHGQSMAIRAEDIWCWAWIGIFNRYFLNLEKMKLLLILMLALSFSACESQIAHQYSPGFDFKLFRHTPVQDLADAVEGDDPARVRAAVHADKANLDFQDEKFGNSLLSLAVYNNKVLAAEVLIDSGANPNLRSAKYGTTPFLTACEYGFVRSKPRLELFSYLITHGGNVNDSEVPLDGTHGEIDTLSNTALVFLIKSGNLANAKLLIDNGAKLDIYPKNGPRSLAFHAAIAPRLDILRYLLIEKGVPIPDYVVIRNEGERTEENISLRQLLMERRDSGEPAKEKMRAEILDYLTSKGK